ncbi:universal stress protein [Pseudonocardia sp. HH130630-07]|uniref:universal stress protein n=1 Tax=Pseudonocardia sp. HH130630-07 TaxID=1690815 RepID=UPI000814C34C|nr:universal stress protein [Pseudonocardia sp. HH130630-07]ANY09041.1 universal stress protein [Pseudonocardia sp. HH130630-07]
MSVLVTVAEGAEGQASLAAGAEEAKLLGTELVVLNLTLAPLDRSGPLADPSVVVIERRGPGDNDPVDAVLDEIADRGDVQRIVIGLRRRSPVSKALLGSISQRLLLESPVPVVAVKPGA